MVFFSCKSVVVSKMCARLNNVCCLSPRLHKIPTFFFFFFSLLFRVLYDTLNPKKRHSRSLQGQHIWGGGCVPKKPRAFLRARSGPPPPRPKNLSLSRFASLYSHHHARQSRRSSLFVFVSLEEEEEDEEDKEDKDEKEGGVSLGVVRV